MVSHTLYLLAHLINTRLLFLDKDHITLFPGLIPPLAQAATLQMCDVRQPQGLHNSACLALRKSIASVWKINLNTCIQ